LGEQLKLLKIGCVLIAPLLLLACGGPGTDTEPPPGPTQAAAVAETGPALTAAQAQPLLEAAVKDRAAEALATPPPGGPSLDEAKSSDRFKVAREQEKLMVAERKARFQNHGFRYTSAATSVQVVDVTGTATKAAVRFDEFGTLHQASDTTGPSDVPEQYRVHETATFLRTGLGWVLDEVLPEAGQFGLPMSMVDPRLPSDTEAPR
jgi:hypothetical protein